MQQVDACHLIQDIQGSKSKTQALRIFEVLTQLLELAACCADFLKGSCCAPTQQLLGDDFAGQATTPRC